MKWYPRQKVLVPIDFSDFSKKAVETGLALVESPANVVILHVIDPVILIDPETTWFDPNDDLRESKTLEQMKQQFGNAPGGPRLLVRRGSPGFEIAQCAKDIQADTIVIPSHGYTGLKHLLLGSVAERVIRYAPCQVLVLRQS